MHFQALDINSEGFWSKARSKDCSADVGQNLGIWAEKQVHETVHWSLNLEEPKVLEVPKFPALSYLNILFLYGPLKNLRLHISEKSRTYFALSQSQDL